MQRLIVRVAALVVTLWGVVSLGVAVGAELRVASDELEIVVQTQTFEPSFEGTAAPDGKAYVTLGIAVLPIANVPLSGFDLGATSHIEDATGIRYEPEPLTPEGGQSFIGPREIAAGDPSFGQLVFVVPADGRRLDFVYLGDGYTLRLPLDGSPPSGGPILPEHLLAGPIEKGGLEFAVESFDQGVGEDSRVVVWVTNRTDSSLRATVGSFSIGVEDGRFGYAPVWFDGPGFSEEAIFAVNTPRRGEAAFSFPPNDKPLSFVAFTADGVVELPLRPNASPTDIGEIGAPAANDVLTAALRGWIPASDLDATDAGSRYAVASIDVGLTNATNMTSIDFGPQFVSLVAADGRSFPGESVVGLAHPFGGVPIWAGLPMGGEVAFAVPTDLSLAGATVVIGGAEPAIRLPVDDQEPPASTLSVTIEGMPVQSGVPIAVTFSGMPGNAEDWLSVANAGSGADQYIEAFSLNGSKEGRVVFSSLAAGDYEVRAYFNWPGNGYRVEQRVPFSIAAKAAAPPGALVAVGRPQIDEGQPVTAIWHGYPGYDGDWIAVARAGDPDDTDGVRYHTLHGRADGRVMFDGLPPGRYELRAYFNGERIVQDRVPFEVVARRFERTIGDDAALPGLTNVALIDHGGWVDARNRDADLIADGNAIDYDDDHRFALIDPDHPTRIWLRRPHPIDKVRFLLWDGAPRNYRYVLKGSADGVNWETLSDHSATPVPGGWQEVATDGRGLIAFSFESASVDGDDPAFRMIEFAAYSAEADLGPTLWPLPKGEMPDWSAAAPTLAVNVAVSGLGATSEGRGGRYAIDGRFDGDTADALPDQPLTIRLGQPSELDAVRVTLAEAMQPAFRVEVSADGEAFEPLAEQAAGSGGSIDLKADGRPVVAIRLASLSPTEPYLTVKEVEAIAVNPPITAVGIVQPQRQVTAAHNLALALNGGRVRAVSSEAESYYSANDLIDGDVETDWHSADAPFPQDVVLQLGSPEPALIDAVDLFASGWGAEPLMVELAIATAGQDEWTSLGRYALHGGPVERISFAPIKASFVRLRVVAGSSGSRVTIGEVAVREAEVDGYSPHVVTHWPGFTGGLNIASVVVGGRIEAASPYSDDPNLAPEKVIDGYDSSEGAWADPNSSLVPQITVGFRDGGIATIAGLAFNPDGGHSSFDGDERWTRLVDVWVSKTDYASGYEWLGRYALDQLDKAQIVSFAPVEARYVRVLMLDGFGTPGAVMGEIEVLEAPGNSITDPMPPNLLDIRYGGHLAVPAGTDRTYLIDSTAATEGWYDSSGARPIDLTFAFNHGEARPFNAIGFNPRTAYDPSTWARRAKVFVSDHPLTGFELIAEVTITPEDRLQYFVFPPVSARYVKVRLLENGGDQAMSLGEVAVREYLELGQVSSVARLEAESDAVNAEDEAVKPFEGELAEAEPNDDTANANALPLGTSLVGRISPLIDKDWYSFDISGQPTRVVSALIEEQPRLRSELSLFDHDGGLIGTQPLYDLAKPSAKFTWMLPGDRNAIELSRARNSIVFIVDRSGSVESVRDDIAAAAVHFAENALPDEEISFVSMDGDELYNDFTSDKDVLIAAAEQTREGSSGSPVYAALTAAMDRLEKRTGAKAIVIVTDGEDSGSSMEPLFDLWTRLGTTGVRIYTVGFGPAVTHPLDGRLASTGGDMLRNFSMATGGRFFYAPTGDAMRDIYAQISADFRSESGYRLKLTAASGKGQLDIVSTGEAITGVSAPRQVGLIFDASGSMKKALEDGMTRMDAARATLHGLIDRLPGTTEVGLMVYGHRLPSRPHDESCNDIELVAPFGALDRAALHQVVASLNPRGETPIGRSLLAMTQSFDPAIARKFVVLITDGEESCDPGPDDPAYPPAVIEALRAAGIDLTLSIVGFAIGDAATQEFLDRLAESTGGSYYDANDQAHLDEALTRAFAAEYSVYDSLGQHVGGGKVGDGPITLPEGTWKVILESDPRFDLGEVEVTAGETHRVELVREGDRLDVRMGN